MKQATGAAAGESGYGLAFNCVEVGEAPLAAIYRSGGNLVELSASDQWAVLAGKVHLPSWGSAAQRVSSDPGRRIGKLPPHDRTREILPKLLTHLDKSNLLC